MALDAFTTGKIGSTQVYNDAFEGNLDARRTVGGLEQWYPYRWVFVNDYGVPNGSPRGIILGIFGPEGFDESRLLSPPPPYTTSVSTWNWTPFRNNSLGLFVWRLAMQTVGASPVSGYLFDDRPLPAPLYPFLTVEKGQLISTYGTGGRLWYQTYDSGYLDEPAKVADPTLNGYPNIWDPVNNREALCSRLTITANTQVRLVGSLRIAKNYDTIEDPAPVAEKRPTSFTWAPPLSAITDDPNYQGTLGFPGNDQLPNSPYTWTSLGSYFNPTAYDPAALPVDYDPLT